jgi:hypothetical protein
LNRLRVSKGENVEDKGFLAVHVCSLRKKRDVMTAKEYLLRLHKADVIINQRIQEKADLRARLSSIGSFDYSKERVQTSLPGSAGYEKQIEKIIDLENEIDQLIDEYVDLKHKIIGEIHELQNSKHIEILYKRYVENKKLEQIAIEMGYTFQYVVLLHGYALKEFSEKHSIYFQC